MGPTARYGTPVHAAASVKHAMAAEHEGRAVARDWRRVTRRGGVAGRAGAAEGEARGRHDVDPGQPRAPRRLVQGRKAERALVVHEDDVADLAEGGEGEVAGAAG